MGLLDKLRTLPRHIAAHADALKAGAGAALRARAEDLRETVGPPKARPVTQPQRAFGRDGGEDVKRVVWTGHLVQSPEGQTYYSAVGLTQHGYYRAAEVRLYGAEEAWRWESARHMLKEQAMGRAEAISAGRLKPEAVASASMRRTPESAAASSEPFANVWRGKETPTPLGAIIAVVNRDTSDGAFYAGVRHTARAEQETAARWLHSPSASKEEAIIRAETFARRGVRSMERHAEQLQSLYDEWREDVSLARRRDAGGATPALSLGDAGSPDRCVWMGPQRMTENGLELHAIVLKEQSGAFRAGTRYGPGGGAMPELGPQDVVRMENYSDKGQAIGAAKADTAELVREINAYHRSEAPRERAESPRQNARPPVRSRPPSMER